MIRDMISVILLSTCLLMAGWTASAHATGKESSPPPREAISKEDQKIADMMEMLTLMDMLEHMDMMKDYDVIKGNAQNDKSD